MEPPEPQLGAYFETSLVAVALIAALWLLAGTARALSVVTRLHTLAERGERPEVQQIRFRLVLAIVWWATFPPSFYIAAQALPPSSPWFHGAVFFLLVLLWMGAAEALPAALAQRWWRSWVRFLPLARSLTMPLQPLVHTLAQYDSEPPTEPAAADEELLLRKLLEASDDDESEAGSRLRGHVKDLVERLVRLRETPVRAVMRPLAEAAPLMAGGSLERAAQHLIDIGENRAPVLAANGRRAVGVLYVKDLFLELQRATTSSEEGIDYGQVGDIVRPARVVRGEQPVGPLMALWRLRGGGVAAVHDEEDALIGFIGFADVMSWLLRDLTGAGSKEIVAEEAP